MAMSWTLRRWMVVPTLTEVRPAAAACKTPLNAGVLCIVYTDPEGSGQS